MRIPRLLTSLLVSLATIDALSPLIIKGSKLSYGNETLLYVKGVQMVREYSWSSMESEDQCRVDSAVMKKLGVNSVKVDYSDSTDMDRCMAMYSDAGIYCVGNAPSFSRGESIPWRSETFEKIKRSIDAFSKYSNTAGFTLGEGNAQAGSEKTFTAPFFKAAIRDIKAYMHDRSYRKIPVGYADSDLDNSPHLLADYLTCAPDPEANADFLTLHYDGHCANYNNNSQVKKHMEQFASSWNSINVPAILLMPEKSCPLLSAPQQETMLDPQGSGSVFSGSFLAWGSAWNSCANDTLVGYKSRVQESNDNYTTILLDGYETPVAVEPRFSSLQAVWQRLGWNTTSLNEYRTSLAPSKCPNFSRGTLELDGAVSLPVLDQLLDNSLRQKWSEFAIVEAGCQFIWMSGGFCIFDRVVLSRERTNIVTIKVAMMIVHDLTVMAEADLFILTETVIADGVFIKIGQVKHVGAL
ncbi:hypothetical protein EJ08DRAFT_698174 [Tothia fuscella]|uniref:1,3-beta-glucanosyltransferase n=1 Tax=Tothia fuscella TaxID=1048955 RepID=A0A9P4NQN1_9PEZI|nr:hypothetical protein EJ08DRAFT_698174 [Tothia fuscella]